MWGEGCLGFSPEPVASVNRPRISGRQWVDGICELVLCPRNQTFVCREVCAENSFECILLKALRPVNSDISFSVQLIIKQRNILALFLAIAPNHKVCKHNKKTEVKKA